MTVSRPPQASSQGDINPPASCSGKWRPTDDQLNFHLIPAQELIQSEISGLKAEGFPAFYLAEWLQALIVDPLKSEEGAA